MCLSFKSIVDVHYTRGRREGEAMEHSNISCVGIVDGSYGRANAVVKNKPNKNITIQCSPACLERPVKICERR